MRAADWIVDIGPGAGVTRRRGCRGGHAGGGHGEPARVLTGQYLSGKKKIEVPAVRRPGNGKFLTVRGARENNLKDIDVSVPLGYVHLRHGRLRQRQVLSRQRDSLQAARRASSTACRRTRRALYAASRALEHLDKVIGIDQTPDRAHAALATRRRTPGLFNDIRDLFASTQDAKARGYGPGRFSFNITRRPLRGLLRATAIVKIEMHFLPDVYVPCEVCNGQALQPRDARGAL